MKCDTLEMIPPVVAMSRVSITRAPVHSGKQGGILTFLGYPRAGTLRSSWARARVLGVANRGNGHGGIRLLHGQSTHAVTKWGDTEVRPS